jgi:hypothetical protein
VGSIRQLNLRAELKLAIANLRGLERMDTSQLDRMQKASRKDVLILLRRRIERWTKELEQSGGPN